MAQHEDRRALSKTVHVSFCSGQHEKCYHMLALPLLAWRCSCQPPTPAPQNCLTPGVTAAGNCFEARGLSDRLREQMCLITSNGRPARDL
jgi:hypothetical protein